MSAWRATSSAPRTSLRSWRRGPKSRPSTTPDRAPRPVARIPFARGREEGLDDLSLGVGIGVGDGVLGPHAPAGAARQLAGRLGGAVDDRRDLVEGHGEDVVEHEREPLGGAQRFEHHEQRETDRVGQ